MPIVQHRPNFSELITKAANERKKLQNSEKKYFQAVHSMLKDPKSPQTVDGEQLEPQNQISVKSNSSSAGLEQHSFHSSKVSSAMVVSSDADLLLESHAMVALRVSAFAVAFVTLSLSASGTASDKEREVITVIDQTIDIFFLFEGLMKLCSIFSKVMIRRDIGDKLKTLDILSNSGVVQMGIASFSFAFGDSKVGAWSRLLRIILISVTFVKQAPHLDVLMSGISLGLHSLFSTWILMFLVFAVYGAWCLHFFGHNDPFHFGTMSLSVWSLFEMCTLDNWEKVMYINMYGCEESPFYYYQENDLTGSPYEGIEDNYSFERYGEMVLPVCRHSEARPALAAVLFISFILICGFILVALTVAVVTAGINERIESLDVGGQQRILAVEGETVKNDKELFVQKFDPEFVIMLLAQVWDDNNDSNIIKPLEQRVHPEKISESVSTSCDSELIVVNSTLLKVFHSATDIRRQSIMMRYITGHQIYGAVFAVVIVIAALLEMISLQMKAENSMIDMVQIFLQVYFVLDLYCRVVAEFPDVSSFFINRWNVFDFVLVPLTCIPLFTRGTTFASTFALLRVLRILRVLRLITWVENLTIILRAISSSAQALFYVVVLMCIFFYNFAVAGVFLFQNNDFYHFGSLRRSFITLFQVCTLANWSDVARTNMYGCDLYGYDLGKPEYDSLCKDPRGLGWIAAWYFLIFIIFGVFVLVQLFLGIIIASMDLLREGIKEEQSVWRKVYQRQNELDMDSVSVNNMLEIFEMVDQGGDGTISLNELRPIVEMVIPNESDIMNMFMKADNNSSGLIDFSEFLSIVHDMGKYYRENRTHVRQKVKAASKAREDMLEEQRSSRSGVQGGTVTKVLKMASREYKRLGSKTTEPHEPVQAIFSRDKVEEENKLNSIVEIPVPSTKQCW